MSYDEAPASAGATATEKAMATGSESQAEANNAGGQPTTARAAELRSLQIALREANIRADGAQEELGHSKYTVQEQESEIRMLQHRVQELTESRDELNSKRRQLERELRDIARTASASVNQKEINQLTVQVRKLEAEGRLLRSRVKTTEMERETARDAAQHSHDQMAHAREELQNEMFKRQEVERKNHLLELETTNLKQEIFDERTRKEHAQSLLAHKDTAVTALERQAADASALREADEARRKEKWEASVQSLRDELEKEIKTANELRDRVNQLEGEVAGMSRDWEDNEISKVGLVRVAKGMETAAAAAEIRYRQEVAVRRAAEGARARAEEERDDARIERDKAHKARQWAESRVKAHQEEEEELKRMSEIDQAERVTAERQLHAVEDELQEAQEALRDAEEVRGERDRLRALVASLQEQLHKATREAQNNTEAETLKVKLAVLEGIVNDREMDLTAARDDVEAWRRKLAAEERARQDREEDIAGLKQKISQWKTALAHDSNLKAEFERELSHVRDERDMEEARANESEQKLATLVQRLAQAETETQRELEASARFRLDHLATVRTLESQLADQSRIMNTAVEGRERAQTRFQQIAKQLEAEIALRQTAESGKREHELTIQKMEIEMHRMKENPETFQLDIARRAALREADRLRESTAASIREAIAAREHAASFVNQLRDKDNAIRSLTDRLAEAQQQIVVSESALQAQRLLNLQVTEHTITHADAVSKLKVRINELESQAHVDQRQRATLTNNLADATVLTDGLREQLAQARADKEAEAAQRRELDSELTVARSELEVARAAPKDSVIRLAVAEAVAEAQRESLLEMHAAEEARRAAVREMEMVRLQLEEVVRERDNLAATVARLEELAAEMRGRVDEEVARRVAGEKVRKELEHRHKVATEQLALAETHANEARAELQSQIAQTRAERDRADEEGRLRALVENDLSGAQAENEALHYDIENLARDRGEAEAWGDKMRGELEAAQAELGQRDTQLGEMRMVLEAKQEEIDTLRETNFSESSAYETTLDTLKRALRATSREAANAVTSLGEVTQERDRLVRENHLIDLEIARLKERDQYVERDFAEARQALLVQQEEALSLRTTLEENNRSVREMQELLRGASAHNEDLLAQLESEGNMLRAAISRRKDVEEANAELSHSLNIARLEVTNTISTLAGVSAQLEDARDSTATAERRLRKAQARLDEAEATVSALKRELEASDQRAVTMEIHLSRLQRQIDTMHSETLVRLHTPRAGEVLEEKHSTARWEALVGDLNKRLEAEQASLTAALEAKADLTKKLRAASQEASEEHTNRVRGDARIARLERQINQMQPEITTVVDAQADAVSELRTAQRQLAVTSEHCHRLAEENARLTEKLARQNGASQRMGVALAEVAARFRHPEPAVELD